MSNRVLLAVLAHPDDESFGMGGTLALYASRGVDVHLVCATRGEVGAADEEYMKGFNSVAEMREAELRCAAGTLGLKSVHFLDYRDSGMPGTQDNNHPDAQVQHPVSEVAGKVVQHIRTLKPEVVATPTTSTSIKPPSWHLSMPLTQVLPPHQVHPSPPAHCISTPCRTVS
jgi:N-acetyl-1-D-myo-inositol-2-amino-2-deoxy-alpha-D-glucopyranoside deacetylase